MEFIYGKEFFPSHFHPNTLSLMEYIFIDGLNNNDSIVNFNRINEINIVALRIASFFNSNGYQTKYLYYDTANSSELRVCSKDSSFLLIYTNRTNCNAIFSFLKNIKKACDKVILFSVNEDITDLISTKYKYVFINEFDNWETTLDRIANLCNLLNIDNRADIINYSLINDISKCSAVIDVGYGCARNCSFCCNRTREFHYREPEQIVNEIGYIISHGIQYFHIYSHSFAHSPSFVSLFCDKIIERYKWDDFAWSCFIIPEDFVDKISLLPKMAKAGLKKIIIGTENGSEKILRNFNLPEVKNATKEIVAAAINSGIVAIEVNLIIGCEFESEETLYETSRFINDLIKLSNGICDIVLKGFYSNLSDCSRCLYREIEVSQSSLHLSKEEICSWICRTNEEIQQLQRTLVSKISLKNRHTIFQLKRFGIYTNLFLLSLNKSLLKYSYGPYGYYSYDLRQDRLSEYTPIFIGQYFPSNEEGNLIVFKDRCLTNGTSTNLSFPVECQTLFEILPEKYKLGEIINRLKGDMNAGQIHSILQTLEYNHLLFYIKTL